MDFLPDLLTVVEWATVFVTFVMMGSGLPACLRMYNQKCISNVPYLLFLTSVFVSVLSLHYGVLINNWTLIFINVLSVLVWGTYVYIYILVSKPKLLAAVGIYSAQMYYLTTLPSHDVIPTLGSFLLLWCTIMCIIPAGEIVTMVQKKSAMSCDLPLLFGGILSSAVWYLYGFLKNDVNIYFPSIPSLLVSAIKIILMFLYGLPPMMTSTETSSPPAVVNTDFHNVYQVKTKEMLRQRK